jgi:hypothetical protein
MTERPYRPADLPSEVVEARKRSEAEEAALLERLRPELDAAIKTARDALDWLERSHAAVADRSDVSLSADKAAAHRRSGSPAPRRSDSAARSSTWWRSAATPRRIPTYRAIFELLGLIGVLGDVHEDEFLAEWLANKEIKQWKVRQAAKRESDRVREQLKADGCPVVVADAEQLMKRLYAPLSDSSHGRREAVRPYISETLRQAATGAHPSALERLVTAEGSLLLLEDLVQVVGDALAFLYGGTFFADHVEPLQETVASAMRRVRTIRQTLERGSR